MGQIPSTLYGNPFNTYVSSKYDCIGNSGDSYYDKLIGGVDCNPVELSKTVIIQYLLSKYNPSTGEGLDCIYNQRPFAGVNDPNYNTEDQLNDTNYLQLFTSYLNTLCNQQIKIPKIIIKTIPMGIEAFSLTNEDNSVEFSTDGGTTFTDNVEITGGETVIIRATGADCADICGASAYDIWLAQGNEGSEQDFLDSLVGPAGPQGEAASIDGLTWRGSWSASPTPTAYVVNDAVQYNGTSYVKIANNNPASGTPDTNSDWEILALEGATGPAGANGAPGTNGAFGVGGFRDLSVNTTTWTLLATDALGTTGLRPLNPQTPIDQTITTLTNDAGVVITFSALVACTLKLPNTLPNFPIGYQVTIIQLGTGQLSVESLNANTVVINSANNMRHLRTQYSAATLIKKSAGNGTTTYDSWYLFGDITNVIIPPTT
jgi:hypothetical protein